VKQDGHVVLRKGTKLMGHVTQTQPRSKANAESSVGVLFNSAVVKGGQQEPIHLGIQALAAAPNQTSASMGSDSGMLASGGSAAGSGRAAGGVTRGAGMVTGNVGQTANGAVGATARTSTSATGSTGGLNAAGQLSSNSGGVFGLEGLNLNAAASNATQDSVVSSTSRNVHLDSGTQMVLQVVKL
jgi:type V secretory pathway adhesin AidA